MNTIKKNFKAILGEFLGSAFISFWGLGFVIPFAVLGYVSNMFEFAAWFGIAFAITVIIFAPISGVHVNPGVTLAWALFGGFNKKLIVPYWIAQILGWAIGVIPLYLIFDGAITDWCASTGSNPVTLFYCSVAESGNVFSGGLLEIFLTGMLTLGIFVLLDKRIPNKPSEKGFPWAIGIVIALTIALGGGYTGTCINPARDLGPRLTALVYGLIKGYDISVIFNNWDWVMFIIAPLIGAVLGGVVHYFVHIKLLPNKEEEKA